MHSSLCYWRLLGVCAWLACAMALLVDAASAAEPFYLRGGERVVFFGDSITQNGGYVTNVELFVRTRFPDAQFEIINHGISSETISGTSEEDHNPRRPDAQNRLTRDVAAWKPQVAVAAFGMNDGNYHPFEVERFALYQAGVRRLIQRATRDECQARLTLLTPPPFDPYRRVPLDPMATSFGYKFPAIDYDDTLKQYSDWLVKLRGEGFVVADVHTVAAEHVRQRREKQVSFTLSPDAVHPDATGHLLMAQTLLLAWRAPSEAGSIEIDAVGPKAINGAVSELKRDGGALQFSWTAPLPWPLDPKCDAKSIALEQIDKKLNRYELKVSGLTAARYQLVVDEKRLGEFKREDLAAGVNLLPLAELPTNKAAAAAFELATARNATIYAAWRKEIAEPKAAGQDAQHSDEAMQSDAKLRELCQPKTLTVRLLPSD